MTTEQTASLSTAVPFFLRDQNEKGGWRREGASLGCKQPGISTMETVQHVPNESSPTVSASQRGSCCCGEASTDTSFRNENMRASELTWRGHNPWKVTNRLAVVMPPHANTEHSFLTSTGHTHTHTVSGYKSYQYPNQPIWQHTGAAVLLFAQLTQSAVLIIIRL